jgi:hypothetical protein
MTEINGRGNSLRWSRNTLYPQRLALTSPTIGGRSVGIVRFPEYGDGVFFAKENWSRWLKQLTLWHIIWRYKLRISSRTLNILSREFVHISQSLREKCRDVPVCTGKWNIHQSPWDNAGLCLSLLANAGISIGQYGNIPGYSIRLRYCSLLPYLF